MWLLVLKMVVSAALIWWAFQGLDTEALMARLAAADWRHVAAAGLLVAALIPVLTVRWVVLARRMRIDLSPLESAVTVYVGFFFNQTLPSSVGGDAVRIWRLTQLGVRLKLAVASVFADRLTGVMGLILIPLIGIAGIIGLLPGMGTAYGILGVLLMLTLALAVILVLDLVPLPWRLAAWSPVVQVREVLGTIRRALQHSGTCGAAVALSMLNHFIVAVVIWLMVTGLGEDAPLAPFLVLVPLVMLTTLVPISVAGWGVRENAMAIGLGYVGISPESAIAASAAYGALAFLVGLGGGLSWLRRPRTEALRSAGPV